MTLIAQSRWKFSLFIWQGYEQMACKAQGEQTDPATAALNSNSCQISDSW